MTGDAPRLPFLLYDGHLRLMQTAIHGATETMRGVTAMMPRRLSPPGDSSGPDELGSEDAPDLGALDASAPALATAMTDTARDALAARGGEGRSVTAGREVHASDGRVPPEEERGPKPLKPQVGP